jgi:preprotein translocase subunit YajC
MAIIILIALGIIIYFLWKRDFEKREEIRIEQHKEDILSGKWERDHKGTEKDS